MFKANKQTKIVSLADYRRRRDENPKPPTSPVASRKSVRSVMLAEIIIADALASYRIAGPTCGPPFKSNRDLYGSAKVEQIIYSLNWDGSPPTMYVYLRNGVVTSVQSR
jgi:hypothetical protein